MYRITHKQLNIMHFLALCWNSHFSCYSEVFLWCDFISLLYSSVLRHLLSPHFIPSVPTGLLCSKCWTCSGAALTRRKGAPALGWVHHFWTHLFFWIIYFIKFNSLLWNKFLNFNALWRSSFTILYNFLAVDHFWTHLFFWTIFAWL